MPDPWIPADEEKLVRLAVLSRPPSVNEYRRRLEGAAIFDDVGRNQADWDGPRREVVSARIDGIEVERALALYEKLLGPEGNRTAWLKQVLQDVVDAYVRTTGAQRVVGFELRRFVKNRPSSYFEAYQALEDLDALFSYHRRMGLAPGEYRPIQQAWLRFLKPDGMTVDELGEAIRPSRYVRGSDVLDIFGD
jgi:hypothetical protein